jgi:hypothetical protein
VTNGKQTDYKEELDRAVAIFDQHIGTFEIELFFKVCPEPVWNFKPCRGQAGDIKLG